MDFHPFKIAVANQFKQMTKQQLFRTTTSKDALWTTYLASFPAGTDPIYKTSTEHDCSCCRSFIKAIGNTVAIVNGKLVTIWDIKVGGAYQVVADALAALVRTDAIANMFLHTEPTAGVDKNFQELLDGVKTWQHFFVHLPQDLVVKGMSMGAALNDPRATHDVMFRSLSEITPESIQTVLELISQNSLYRGEEQKFAVTSFQKLKREFDKLPADGQARDNYVWSSIKGIPESVSRIRNTAIGTLLVDISTDVDLEVAVGKWDAMMAPTNYKRPTALVTKAMIEKAQKEVEALGLMSALERRYAVVTDVTVNNVMFANRTSKANMTGNVFTDLAAALPEKTKSYDKVEEVTIEKFVADILPLAESVEILLENAHAANLVSLIAPVDPTAGKLFKWDNGFSWSYSGEVADSIKERVKKAGGNVSGDLCCRLAWYNYDDLDLWMIEPDGTRISYQNKRSPKGGGQLDVDMNAGGGSRTTGTREPVENIFYPNRAPMKEGIYKLGVNNFQRMETVDVGFEVEMDYLGSIRRFVYDKPVKDKENILVVEFKYTHAKGVEILQSLPSTQAVRKVWELPTQTFHKVDIMMLSPNHWDGHGVGNKHYFFMLENCINEGTARGFFNEFLNSSLEPHRKALEMVGAKMRAAESNNQLSGLGFSSTQRNEVVCRVKGALTRTLKIVF